MSTSDTPIGLGVNVFTAPGKAGASGPTLASYCPCMAGSRKAAVRAATPSRGVLAPVALPHGPARAGCGCLTGDTLRLWSQ
jgi:hypothetical protein